LTVLVCVLVWCSQSSAESLREILSSDEMRRLHEQTEIMYQKQGRGSTGGQNFMIGIDPNSEFARIWRDNRGPELLLNWLGINLPNYTVKVTGSHRARELVQAGATLSTRSRERVNLEVLIPHPTFHTMVHFKTLRDFNVYEPPTLEIVAEEELSFKQVKGMYYRTPRGQCSILIKVERLGIVNLSVQQCEYSNIMTDIINTLDFERLNKKLTS
jgi:hypothetical protein